MVSICEFFFQVNGWYMYDTFFLKKTMIYKQPLIYLFFHFYFNAIDTEVPLALNSSLRIHDTVLFRTQCFPTNQRGDWLQTRELDRGLHWLWFLTIWHAHSIKRGREGGGHTCFVNENVDYSLLKELPSHPILGGVKKFKVYVMNVSVFSFCLL